VYSQGQKTERRGKTASSLVAQLKQVRAERSEQIPRKKSKETGKKEKEKKKELR